MWNRQVKRKCAISAVCRRQSAKSSSLPPSGVFFVIQLRALYTAKHQGRGFYCSFFHWCPRWFGLKKLFLLPLFFSVRAKTFLATSASRGQMWCTCFLTPCQTEALHTRDDVRRRKLRNSLQKLPTASFGGGSFISNLTRGRGKSKLWNQAVEHFQGLTGRSSARAAN